MNQLEALQQLYVQKRTITLPKNPKEGQKTISIEFEPLSLDDMALFGKATDVNVSPEEFMRLMKELIAKCLSVEVQQLSKVSLEYMKDLMDYLMEIHNFGDEDESKTERLKEFMAQKQNITPPNKSSEIQSVQ